MLVKRTERRTYWMPIKEEGSWEPVIGDERLLWT